MVTDALSAEEIAILKSKSSIFDSDEAKEEKPKRKRKTD